MPSFDPDLDDGDMWGLLPPGAGAPGRGWRYWLSAMVVGIAVGIVLGLLIFG